MISNTNKSIKKHARKTLNFHETSKSEKFKDASCVSDENVHKPSSSLVRDLNAQFPLETESALQTDVWSACSMYKQRVIEAKPTFLTPKSVSKLYGSAKSNSSSNLKNVSSFGVSPGKAHALKYESLASEALFEHSHTKIRSTESELSDSVSCGTTTSSISVDRSLSITDGNHLEEALVLPKLSTAIKNHDSSLSLPPPMHLSQHQRQYSYEENKPEPIQLSPTVSFPVSRINHDDVYQRYNFQSPTLSAETVMSSLNDDIESLDQSSEISTFSYASSMSYGPEVAVQHDVCNLQQKAYTQFNSGCQCQHKNYEKAVKEMKSALKLAEADTAILVSSKQQLQLDNHGLNETVKALNYEISKLKHDITEKDLNIAVLKRNNSTSESKSAELLQIAEENLKTLQAKFEKTSSKLDEALLENEQLENKRREISQNFEAKLASNKSLEAEVNQLMVKCSRLEAQLNETVVDSSDNSAYISLLREERDNYAVKVHSQEQDIIGKQMSISQLEERLNAINEQYNAINVSYQTLLQVSKSKESSIASLQSQLAAKEKEKQALDGAISRLHDDLFKVEASFTKIKSEMIQKTMASNQEMSIKQHFEKQIVLLKDDLKRVHNDCKSFTQKISDKNNQISQLSEQLKRALLAKQKCETDNKMCKSKLAENQKLCKEAMEKEKQLLSTVEKRSRELSKKDEMLLQSSAAAESFKQQFDKSQKKLDEFQTQLINTEKEKGVVQKKFETLQKTYAESERTVASKTNLINELEKEVQRCTSINNMLSEQLEKLKITKEKPLSSPADDHLSHVVAELQASRREISERNQKLEEENKVVRNSFENLKLESVNLKTQMAAIMDDKKNIRREAAKVQARLAQVTSQLEEARKSEGRSSDQLSQLNEDFSLVQDQLAATKYSLTQSKIDLKSKIKELSALSQSNATLTEELETAKNEMNAANMKLVELINSHQENNDDHEKIELFERLQTSETERSKLNEAVLQQQRYITSLQAHYQKWASDASVKFEEMQSRQQQSSMITRDVGSQTSHENKPLPISPQPSLETLRSTCLVDSFTQTYHDEKPVNPSPVKKAAKNILCSSCGKPLAIVSQGDILLNETSNSSDAVNVSVLDVAAPQKATVIPTTAMQTQTTENGLTTETLACSSDAKTFKSMESQTNFQVQTSAKAAQTELFAETLNFREQLASMTCQTDDFEFKDRNFSGFNHCDAATQSKANVVAASCQTELSMSLDLRNSATQTLSPPESLLPSFKHLATQTTSSSADKLVQTSVDLLTCCTQTEDTSPVLVDCCAQTDEDKSDSNEALRAIFNDKIATSTQCIQTNSNINLFSLPSPTKPSHTSYTQTDFLTIYSPRTSSDAGTQASLSSSENLPDKNETSNSHYLDSSSQTNFEQDLVPTANISSQTIPSLSARSPDIVSIPPVQKQNAGIQVTIAMNNVASQTDEEKDTNTDTSLSANKISSLSLSSPHVINISPVQSKDQHCQAEMNTTTNRIQTEDAVCNSSKNVETLTLEQNLISQTDHCCQTDGFFNNSKTSNHKDNATQTFKIELKSSSCNTDQSVNPGADICNDSEMQSIQNGHAEDIYSQCGRNVLFPSQRSQTLDAYSQTDNPISLPEFPNTADFLNNINMEDKAKLKAYKQTVKVLRGKLKQAEKQLALSQEAFISLKCEFDALKCNSLAEAVMLDQTISNKETNDKLERELSDWKESVEQKDSVIESLQQEMDEMLKRYGAEKEKMRRKSKAERLIKEKKLKEVSDRLKMLVDANERLRKNVDKLQIKLTSSNQQLETCQREKLRYQLRARKLQTDLRSLSWIASTTPDQQNAESIQAPSPSTFELPPAVKEIDDILQVLRNEIGVLEEQLHQHSSAIHQSKTTAKDPRSYENTSFSSSGDGPLPAEETDMIQSPSLTNVKDMYGMKIETI